MGIGDWGLGIGPNPQSPIPNPQSPIPISFIINEKIKTKNLLFDYNYIKTEILNNILIKILINLCFTLIKYIYFIILYLF